MRFSIRFFVTFVVGVCLVPSAIHGNPCPELAGICFCNSKLTSVNCEGKGLTSLPDGIPLMVEKLFLGYNHFTTLSSFMFNKFKSLTYVRLGHNKISKIQSFAFASLSLMHTLDLTNNDILSVDENAFAGMPSLTKLYLNNNRIQKVADGAFNGTASLQIVNLQANELLTVPSIGDQPRLEALVLFSNEITNATFPESFVSCKKLSQIVLSQNSIATLTNETFIALTSNLITKLDLSQNRMRVLEAGAFSPLASLLSLKLGFNPIDGQALKIGLYGLQGKPFVSLNIANISLQGNLPSDTFQLLANASLKSLLMHSNNIQKIPDYAFSQLKNLLVLDLSRNGISQISDHAFEGLEKLNQLNLFRNRLAVIPQNLPVKLLHLNLYSNQIRQVTSGCLKNLAALQILDLSSNSILTLETDSFFDLVGLQNLYLDHNQINTLPGGVFSSLVQLVSLELNNNKLLTIQQQKDRFTAQGKLVYLNLADNNLRTFPIDMLAPLSSLRFLHLEGNEIGPILNQDQAGVMFKGLKNLQDLYLMNNKISVLHDAVFQDLQDLRMLNVTWNWISKLERHTFSSCPKLKSLDLSYNLISVLREECLTDLHLDCFNLTGNPFACTCDLREFRDWIKKNTTHLTRVDNYTCNSPKEWSGRPLLSFDRTKINCTFFTLPTIIAISSAVFLVSIVVFFIIYRNRWHIRLGWYRFRNGKRKRGRKLRALAQGYEEVPGDAVELFDAYISYSEDDERWVIDHLLPDIDNGELHELKQFGGEFRLYFKERDSIPGSSKIGDIDTYLTASKKMIVVLSNRYQNGLNSLELDEATQMLCDRQLEDIIVVKIEDVKSRNIPRPLYRQMKQGRFLDWQESEVGVRVFKEELKRRLRVVPEVMA